jgi:hypothetical protein
MANPPRTTRSGQKTQTDGFDLLGDHPVIRHPLGDVLNARDRKTETQVPHRALSEKEGKRAAIVASIREMLLRHHASPAALKRIQQHREAMKRLGFEMEQSKLRLFPTNPSTRKGNLAEVVLAEYVVAANGVTLPLYRLRYNPNVDQSMKGDDVLAFDLDTDPVRVIVGEAKFRGASSAAAVKEIVDGLVRSYKGGVPISLQFVAERLFEAGQDDIGARVLECAKLFALGRLRINYVGMLLSDKETSKRVDSYTPDSLRRLVMISLCVEEPDSLIEPCYAALE